MTGPRRTIASVLSAARDYPDVEEVYRRAARLDPRISIATVYRTVRLFDAKGILKRWSSDRGRARCEPAEGDPRHHLIDAETGLVITFQDAPLDEALRAFAARLGYTLLDQNLRLFGVRKVAPDESGLAASSATKAPLVTREPRGRSDLQAMAHGGQGADGRAPTGIHPPRQATASALSRAAPSEPGQQAKG